MLKPGDLTKTKHLFYFFLKQTKHTQELMKTKFNELILLLR